MIAMMAVIIAIIAIVLPVGAHSSCVEEFLIWAVSLSSFLASCRTRSSESVIPSFLSHGQTKARINHRERTPLALTSVSRYFPPAVAKTYVVTFRSHNDDRPSKFIVLANDRKAAINMAWEHGGSDFQSRFDKSTGQAHEMKEGALRVLWPRGSGVARSECWSTLRFPSCRTNS